MASSSSSSSSSSPQQEQATPNNNNNDNPLSLADAQTCLTVLRGSAAQLSTHVQGVRVLLGAMAVLQSQEEAAAAMRDLRTLRDALNEVLEDGGSEGGERKRKRGTASLDESEKRSSAVRPTPRVAVCAQVLQDPHLLTRIIGWLFHEHHTLPSRVALGQTALVCKEWKYISRHTCFWRPLLRELRPVVRENDESLTQSRGYEGHFAFLCKYGQCIADEQILMDDMNTFDNFELQMEVWNAGDGEIPSHRPYSASGPIQAVSHAGAIPQVVLRTHGPQRKEVAGPAFSAADLDPVQRRYPTIADCLQTSQETSNPLNLCMRVTVLDRRTGRMALSVRNEERYSLPDDSCSGMAELLGDNKESFHNVEAFALLA